MKEDNRQVMSILRQFKEPDGNVHYPSVFMIPSEQRIPAMAKADYEGTNMLIIGALTVALENINVKRGLNEFQILTLSELIIQESSEDNLSLEDLVLFLQNMITGKYQMSYESMDVPKFMTMFEIYREERFQALRNYQMDLQAQYSCSGDTGRTYKEDALSEHMSRLGDTIGRLKEDLRDTRKENNYLKQADKL